MITKALLVPFRSILKKSSQIHLNEFWLNLQLQLSGWRGGVVLEVWEVGHPHLDTECSPFKFLKDADHVEPIKYECKMNGRGKWENEKRKWGHDEQKRKGESEMGERRKGCSSYPPTHLQQRKEDIKRHSLAWKIQQGPINNSNQPPTHWRWVRRPSRWNGARTSVSMVRSNSDLVEKRRNACRVENSEGILQPIS